MKLKASPPTHHSSPTRMFFFASASDAAGCPADSETVDAGSAGVSGIGSNTGFSVFSMMNWVVLGCKYTKSPPRANILRKKSPPC
jgi:hypothetical protein